MLDDHGLLRQIYDNSHPVDGSRQMGHTYPPSQKNIARWADRGIKTAISLRGYLARTEGRQLGFYWLKKKLASSMDSHLRTSGSSPAKRRSTNSFQGSTPSSIGSSIRRYSIEKSSSDQSRLASVLYLFLHENLSLDEAIAQLSLRYGHLNAGRTKVLDRFFDIYLQAARRDGAIPNRAHFLTWVACDDDLEEMNYTFKAIIFGSLLTEKILQGE